ncbi:OmpA family protein [Succinatimonas hippei]|uniref:OmpA family protein n=1 Tax=Succinatimonas hippei TaxID=626938 RepID=UPI00255C7D73|nr:OmpA family protein [Succinatimonas hippei]
MKAKILSLSVIAALGFAVAAQAAVPETAYVGVRGGWAHMDMDTVDWASADDKDAVGYGIYAGYNFTSWAAIEAGYNFFDGFSYTAKDSDTGAVLGSEDFTVHGPEAALRLAFPLGPDGSDIYVRGGAMWATYKFDSSTEGNYTAHEIAPFVGAGVQYAVTKNFGVRVGYDYYFNVVDKDGDPDTDIGLLYAGLQFTFGGSEPAPAPAPAPQTVTENFTLDAATLFPFDGSSLCEEGVKAVNDVVDSVNAKNIQNAAYDVKGYTDRIGSEAYNQTLSEKRAQAVADQLQAAGVAPEQLTVTGMGEADPVSTGCEGLRGNKLVDCLAPDRRVELSVTGEVTEAE